MAVIINELEVMLEAPNDKGPQAGEPQRPQTGRSQAAPQSPSTYDIIAVLEYHAAREERVRAH